MIVMIQRIQDESHPLLALKDEPPTARKMKYLLSLAVMLAANWLLWSGHFDNAFLLILGAASLAVTLWIVKRMRIMDSETAPADFGIRPLFYVPYLIKEIAQSNLDVSKIVLSPAMPMQRNMIEVTAKQRSEVGRVVMANSITLTPGTVSIRVAEDKILVHALSLNDAEEDLSGEMNRRVCMIEGPLQSPSLIDPSPPSSTPSSSSPSSSTRGDQS